MDRQRSRYISRFELKYVVGIEQIGANLVAQPAQVFRVGIVDCGTELHLYREDPLVGTLHDQIYFARTAFEPEMAYLGLRRLSEHPHRQRHQRLEQMAKQCSVPWNRRS